MKKYVKVSLTFYKEYATQKKILEEKKLREKLKPYVVGNGGWVLGDYYKFEIPSELYSEVLRFGKSKRSVDLHIDYIDEYDSEELKNAKLFLLTPKKTYMQNKEIYEYTCEKCTCRDLISRMKIVINKDIKCGQVKKVFKIGEGIEELYCVSEPLYNFLIENGVNAVDFSPVFKGNQVKAYAFTPKKVCNIISNLYTYKKCKKCGKIYAEFNKKKRNQPEQLALCEQINFSQHDSFRTLCYYDGEQKVLVSPKLYYLIKEYIKSDEAIPIFEEKLI